MEQAKTIYQKLCAARAAADRFIQKDKSVSTGKSSYKAVTHDAVTALLRQYLVENGILIIPSYVQGSEKRFEIQTQNGVSIMNSATYRFTVCGEGGDSFQCDINAAAGGNDDKYAGKILSYATKMLMLKLFNMVSGDNEEDYFSLTAPSVDLTRLADAMKRYSPTKFTTVEAFPLPAKVRENGVKSVHDLSQDDVDNWTKKLNSAAAEREKQELQQEQGE